MRHTIALRFAGRRRSIYGTAVALAFALAACTGGTGDPAPSAGLPADASAASPSPTVTAAPTASREERIIDRLSARFDTDFSRRSISLTELLDGGPGKDGIPAIDDPEFVGQDEASAWLGDDEPVIAFELNGEARAYPLQILTWHEMVNDTVGGVPVLVTFCPLCNTAIAFDRRVDGETRSFGVSGLLRNSDLVMYDRTNESLWQQITGDAIVGADLGTRLSFLPSQIVSFAQFRQAHPDGPVLSRNTGHSRPYGTNPYTGYDRADSSPLFPVAGDDDRLAPKERVLAIELAGDNVAIPFSVLEERGVMEVEVGGEPVVAFWQPGTVSALDERDIHASREVGSATAYRPFLDGEQLEFESRDGEIFDVGTGSRWNVLGQAVEGELAGARLEPVLSGNHLWFAWAAFKPDARVVR